MFDHVIDAFPAIWTVLEIHAPIVDGKVRVVLGQRAQNLDQIHRGGNAIIFGVGPHKMDQRCPFGIKEPLPISCLGRDVAFQVSQPCQKKIGFPFGRSAILISADLFPDCINLFIIKNLIVFFVLFCFVLFFETF